MVISIPLKRRCSGMLLTDLVVAMGILVIAMIPLSFSFVKEKQLCHAYYCRAVVMEIADGEMEKLVSGEWHNYKPGRQSYAVKADAAKRLQGSFTLDVQPGVIRLEWNPTKHDEGGHFVREANIQ